MKRFSTTYLVSSLLVGSLGIGSTATAQAEDSHRVMQLVIKENQRLATERLPYLAFFDEAYRRYPQLPEGVLEAVAFVGSRWIHLRPAAPYDGCMRIPQAYGIMGLFHGDGDFRNVVGEAADALGVSEAAVMNDPRANILATAALLDQYRQEAGLQEPLLEELEPLLERLSGLPYGGEVTELARQSHAYDILQALDQGHEEDGMLVPRVEIAWELAFEPAWLRLLRAPRLRVVASEDVVELPDRSVRMVGRGAGSSARVETATTDYAPALWVTSPNYSSRNGSAITHHAIHTVQGSYSSCISWFQNPSSQTSSHYVMRSSDGQVTQMVREYDKAWHIGSENPYTLGTEHEGYVSTPSYYTTAMYNASAALSKDQCASNKFDCNTCYGGASSSSTQVLSSSYHIKGHQHYPNQTHTDPGIYWDWPRYKSLVSTSTTPPVTTTSKRGNPRVKGDFNGDGKEDVAVAYDYGNSRTALWIFPSNGKGYNAATMWWDSGAGSWEASRSQWVAGDFNKDGKSDVACLYDYGNALSRIWVLLSTGTKFSGTVVWYDSGAGNFAASTTRIVSGDFNGDGRHDIMAAYDYGSNHMALWAFLSTGTTFSTARWYDNNGGFNAKAAKWVSGNFNGDTKTDVACLYDYGNATSSLIVFPSSGSSFPSSQWWYSSGAGNFDWARASLMGGDANGDKKSDVIIAYDYGSSHIALWTYLSTGTAFTWSKWYDNNGGWEGSRSQWVGADLTGDGKTDVAALYNYDNATSKLWSFLSSGSSFSSSQVWYDSGKGNFDWTRSSAF